MTRQKRLLFFLFFFILWGCNERTFDIILFSNQKYEPTDINKILVVGSRLEIKDKFYEIGVIKATRETDLRYIKEKAAKYGAEIIIDEGNLNYTLARFKNHNKKEESDDKSVKI